MLILGIDSSDDFISVGLMGDDGIIASQASDLSGQNKNMLHEAISQLMRENGLEMQMLNGVAVALGPGSFTGLRVGLAVAKGISWSLKIPLVGISSLMAIAACSSIESGKILALKDARRDEFYFAGFTKNADTLFQEIPDSVGSFEDVDKVRSKGFIPAGPGVPAFGKKYKEEIEKILIDIDQIGGAIAKLGMQKIIGGDILDTASVVPHYIRAPKAKVWNH